MINGYILKWKGFSFSNESIWDDPIFDQRLIINMLLCRFQYHLLNSCDPKLQGQTQIFVILFWTVKISGVQFLKT